MLFVKIKSVRCHAKQIFRLGLCCVACRSPPSSCSRARAGQCSARRRRPQERFRVLVFTKTTGFRHDSIPDGVRAIQRLGRRHRFAVDTTGDAATFTTAAPRALRRGDLPLDHRHADRPRGPAAGARGLHPGGRRLRRHPRGVGHARALAVVRGTRRRPLQASRSRHLRARRSASRTAAAPRPAACRRSGGAATSGTSSAATRAGACACSRRSTSRVRWPGATTTMAAARCTRRWVIHEASFRSRASSRICAARSQMAAGRARFDCAP